MNSLKNSSTMKKCTDLIEKKLKINLQLKFLTGISDNYMIETAPNRHTDHASERELFKGTRSVPPTKLIQTLIHTRTHTLHLKEPFIPPPCPQ